MFNYLTNQFCSYYYLVLLKPRWLGWQKIVPTAISFEFVNAVSYSKYFQFHEERQIEYYNLNHFIELQNTLHTLRICFYYNLEFCNCQYQSLRLTL